MRGRLFIRSSMWKKAISSLFCAMFLTACAYPRALDPVFATRAGKYRMLNESVAHFHRSLNWGDPGEAVEHVAPEFQGVFVQRVVGPASGNRITEVRLDRVDFPASEDAKAYVFSTVRYYGPPSIEVRAYSAKQTWTYSRMDGAWQLVDAIEAETNNNDPGAMGGFIR